MSRWQLACVAALVGCLGPASSQGTEPASAADHPVVLRISSEVLNSFVDKKEVERNLTIQDNILGTSVYGTAQVTGMPGIVLKDCPDKAMFWITLKGTVAARTTGYNGPAIVYSLSTTNFNAYRLVSFEPGKGFVGSPVQVAATTSTITDGIDSTRGGLIGRIVRRRASRIEAGQRDQVQEIIRQRASSRVRANFQKQSDERLAKMNEGADLQMLAGGNPMPAGLDLKYFCCTTPKYLQIASQVGDTSSKLVIPHHDPANPRNAPIEIWMHDSFADTRFSAGFDLLKLQAEKTNLGLTVSSAAKLMSLNSEATNMIPDQLGEKVIRLHQVQDWRVAKLEILPREVVQVVRVLRPETAFGLSGPRGPVPAAGIAQAAPVPVPTPVPVASRPTVTHQTPSTEARTWTSGTYTADARFVSLEGDTVRLQRTNGVNTRVRFDRLSAGDQTWIRQYVSTPPLTAGVPPMDTE